MTDATRPGSWPGLALVQGLGKIMWREGEIVAQASCLPGGGGKKVACQTPVNPKA